MMLTFPLQTKHTFKKLAISLVQTVKRTVKNTVTPEYLFMHKQKSTQITQRMQIYAD